MFTVTATIDDDCDCLYLLFSNTPSSTLSNELTDEYPAFKSLDMESLERGNDCISRFMNIIHTDEAV